MSDIPPEDLEWKPWPDWSQGGQHVGVSCGVSVEHLPTGITVIVNTDRSRRINKAIALDALMGALTSPHMWPRRGA